ncbi:MAG: hypothetical protein A3G18_08570 [Rhodospirillales bacterium RIFCSPLOWO2_12_FULL_58_28]|nr:MAG: hypothetical protein A3H92_01425 [Rhodospirillales bacterium RIFCSPLOWO2_02_FULL_58_16]OHC79732.1 MAG: hypothetical protein A3G18_08570 [Rhodospirillales bacterium RIFCSPLOWO2_12_FULL_58_28]
MELVEGSLEETLQHLAKEKPDDFPTGHTNLNYFKRYTDLRDKLNAEFHPHVRTGAMITDGGLLTDHGPDHIKTVINRSGQLLHIKDDKQGYDLTGYEIYLLLVAIHFHDVANILGRDDHEKRIGDVMAKYSSHLGDSVEQEYIQKIAGAHGGNIDGDKDTISRLPYEEPVNCKRIRLQILASILRFADELADDSSRASTTIQEFNNIPGGSEVFHKYASCLNSVMVDPSAKSVELHFFVNVADLTRTFGKKTNDGVEQVYLLDEIYSRTLKTHIERIYCSRFMVPFVDIRTIYVRVKGLRAGEEIGEKMPTIDYRLEETGYPEAKKGGVLNMCGISRNWNGGPKKLTGEVLAKKLIKDAKNKGNGDA